MATLGVGWAHAVTHRLVLRMPRGMEGAVAVGGMRPGRVLEVVASPTLPRQRAGLRVVREGVMAPLEWLM